MKIAVTGAGGFVGIHLLERLMAEGHQVLALVRDPAKLNSLFPAQQYPNLMIVAYTPKESGSWQQSIAGCDGVVNLAGEPLAGDRWTPERKQEIIDSRQQGTQKLVEAIAEANPRPQVLVNASAIGYYGTSETSRFDEQSPPGNDFLAQVCQRWEAEAEKVKAYGTRLVILRFGIVLGMGGAIAKMLPPFKLYAGGVIGSGRQWFSWIHLEDLVSLILECLTDPEREGVFNATSPHPVRMAEVCTTLGQLLHRPTWLPVPEFVLELLLGEAAQVVLEGQQVIPERLQNAHFNFRFAEIEAALQDILAQSTL